MAEGSIPAFVALQIDLGDLRQDAPITLPHPADRSLGAAQKSLWAAVYFIGFPSPKQGALPVWEHR
jgi:hypothetical protein